VFEQCDCRFALLADGAAEAGIAVSGERLPLGARTARIP